MRTKIDIGDFLCVYGGYDLVDVLVISKPKPQDSHIMVDEIFTRDLRDRVRLELIPHDYVEVINDKPYQKLLYNKLMNREYGKEYQKFFRKEKLKKLNGE